MRFAVGQSFPAWQLRAVCDDGVAFADMTMNRFWTLRRTRWLDAIDGAVSGNRTALEIARDSVVGFSDYALSTARLKKRSDAFFRSMAGSICAFHAAVDKAQTPPLDGSFGQLLVETCERLASQIAPETSQVAPPLPAYKSGAAPDVAVIGGTGFIGTQVVSGLVDAGLRVAVLARNIRNLPAIFGSEHVELHKGDIRDERAVASAISGAGAVINLAHGGGGDSWEAIRNSMVGGTDCVARACLAGGTARLLYVSSIACLYLGPQRAQITGATPPDPQASRRATYARAKALCETLLTQLHASDGLPVCILRPGLVVGPGTSPFHSGLGFYNNEQHCIGWNSGRNPLPFVLVEDVASAIVAALHAPHVVGRSYNLVGDVRLTAREYLAALAGALRRPLQFHPKSPVALYLEDMGKWSIKAMTGRGASLPSLRDFRSRGLMAKFDCSDTKRDLGWNPVCDHDVFIARAIASHI
jgi:nucleoside-diphosphate-sugar epimerase